MDQPQIKQIKTNIELLKIERDKLEKSQQLDYKKIIDVQQRISKIEEEELLIQESLSKKDQQLQELKKIIEESQYSYDKLDNHIKQVNEILKEELQNLKQFSFQLQMESNTFLLVIGPAGSGKSTFCQNMKLQESYIKSNILLVNFDAGNINNFDYDFCIQELIQQREIQQELQIGLVNKSQFFYILFYKLFIREFFIFLRLNKRLQKLFIYYRLSRLV